MLSIEGEGVISSMEHSIVVAVQLFKTSALRHLLTLLEVNEAVISALHWLAHYCNSMYNF